MEGEREVERISTSGHEQLRLIHIEMVLFWVRFKLNQGVTQRESKRGREGEGMSLGAAAQWEAFAA